MTYPGYPLDLQFDNSDLKTRVTYKNSDILVYLNTV